MEVIEADVGQETDDPVIYIYSVCKLQMVTLHTRAGMTSVSHQNSNRLTAVRQTLRTT